MEALRVAVRRPFRRRTQPRVYVLLLLFLLLGGSLPAATAQDEGGGLEMAVQAGFDGYYKQGAWVPVRVTLANAGAGFLGEVRVPSGYPGTGEEVVYNTFVDLPTRSNKEVSLLVFVPQFATSLSVELLDEAGQPRRELDSNRLSLLAPQDLLYGIVSSQPGELAFLEDVMPRSGRAAAAFLSIDDLPATAVGWEALDVLVLDDVDSGRLSPAQRTAMENWIVNGGQLVITGGPNWQQTVTPLADLLPVEVTGTVNVEDLPRFQQAVGPPFRDPGPYIVAESMLRDGTIIYQEEGLPLLTRRDIGRGAVYFLALDPKLAPLRDWDGNSTLWTAVAGGVTAAPPWAAGIENTYAATTAVSSIPSLALPSALLLVFFLFVYIVIIGPVNYLVLKRLGRRELAWVTIPVLVLVFSGLTYFIGFQIKGNDTLINQMSVAYGRVDSASLEVESVVGLYSPRRDIYDLTVPGDAALHPIVTFTGGASTLDAVTQMTEVTATGVRTDVSDVVTFLVDSYQPAPDLDATLGLEAVGSDIVLQGSVRNNGDTLLEDVSVLIGADIITVGDLAPGETQQISRTVGTTATSPADPLFRPQTFYGSPLMVNAEQILGTADFYNDQEAFPRWQLLQALEPNAPSVTPGTNASGQLATLIAWSDQPQVEAAVDQPYAALSTTLYLLEIPLAAATVQGEDVSVPFTMLDWRVLDSNGGFVPQAADFYVSSGWAEYEFKPWEQFADLTVQSLDVVITAGSVGSGEPAPQVSIWDWQAESWQLLEDLDWGETALADPARYVGPANAVRLRLQQDIVGASVGVFYPRLSGDIN